MDIEGLKKTDLKLINCIYFSVVAFKSGFMTKLCFAFVILGISSLTSTASNNVGTSTLVLLDNLSIKETHAAFFKRLFGKNMFLFQLIVESSIKLYYILIFG